MLKDHVDFDELQERLRKHISHGEPAPIIADWRRATPGEKCDGCGRPFRSGEFVQVARGDGSVGHVSCHLGQQPGEGMRVTFGRAELSLVRGGRS